MPRECINAAHCNDALDQLEQTAAQDVADKQCWQSCCCLNHSNVLRQAEGTPYAGHT